VAFSAAQAAAAGAAAFSLVTRACSSAAGRTEGGWSPRAGSSPKKMVSCAFPISDPRPFVLEERFHGSGASRLFTESVLIVYPGTVPGPGRGTVADILQKYRVLIADVPGAGYYRVRYIF
jgi:hypothetical protein